MIKSEDEKAIKEEGEHVCCECSTTETSYWRRDNIDKEWDGKSRLCNACYWQKDKLYKEKRDARATILLSMYAMRAFSLKFQVDLYTDKDVINEWNDVLIKSCEKLKKLGIVELGPDNLFDKNGIDPVGNLFRVNASGLGKMTEGMFKINGDMRYFLDISMEKTLEDSIGKLWKMIVGEKILDREKRREAYSFCSSIYNDKHISIFGSKHHNFHSSKYEIIIKDTILFFS